MKNITLKRQGSKLIIEIDLTKTVGPSSSGKSIIVATTAGNAQVPDDSAKVGVNVYRPVADKAEEAAA